MKRPFAKKTANMAEGSYKDVATAFQSMQKDAELLSISARKGKDILKKEAPLREEYDTLKKELLELSKEDKDFEKKQKKFDKLYKEINKLHQERQKCLDECDGLVDLCVSHRGTAQQNFPTMVTPIRENK